MTEKSTITCEAVYSEDKTHRFTWKRIWDGKKPELCVITLNPNADNVFELDLTSMLVTNNTYRLEDYGGVIVVNLFSCLTDRLRKPDFEEENSITAENLKYIKKAAKESDVVVIAWGKSGNTNRKIKEREALVLSEIMQFREKLRIIVDDNGEAGLHPLTPSVRNKWNLVSYFVREG